MKWALMVAVESKAGWGDVMVAVKHLWAEKEGMNKSSGSDMDRVRSKTLHHENMVLAGCGHDTVPVTWAKIEFLLDGPEQAQHTGRWLLGKKLDAGMPSDTAQRLSAPCQSGCGHCAVCDCACEGLADGQELGDYDEVDQDELVRTDVADSRLSGHFDYNDVIDGLVTAESNAGLTKHHKKMASLVEQLLKANKSLCGAQGSKSYAQTEKWRCIDG